MALFFCRWHLLIQHKAGDCVNRSSVICAALHSRGEANTKATLEDMKPASKLHMRLSWKAVSLRHANASKSEMREPESTFGEAAAIVDKLCQQLSEEEWAKVLVVDQPF